MRMSMSTSAVAGGSVALEPLAVPPPPAGATPGTRVRDLLAGARAMAPWLVGIVPYGLVIGVSAARADIPTAAGWLTAPLVYSGSAQVATIELLDAGAAPLVVVATALVINLRLVLYSATMAQHWQGTPRWWRALAAYLLVDPSVAVGVDGYRHATDRRRGHLHYIGGAALLWVVWLVAIGIGATAGTHLPACLAARLRHPPVPGGGGGRPARRPRHARGGGGRGGGRRRRRVRSDACGRHAGDRRWRRGRAAHPGERPVNTWLVVVAAGVGTYLLRISMIALAARTALPPVLGRATRFAVPAAFAALAAAGLAGQITADAASLAPVGAVAAAVLAVRRTGSTHAALVVGMPTLWMLSAVTG